MRGRVFGDSEQTKRDGVEQGAGWECPRERESGSGWSPEQAAAGKVVPQAEEGVPSFTERSAPVLPESGCWGRSARGHQGGEEEGVSAAGTVALSTA